LHNPWLVPPPPPFRCLVRSFPSQNVTAHSLCSLPRMVPLLSSVFFPFPTRPIYPGASFPDQVFSGSMFVGVSLSPRTKSFFSFFMQLVFFPRPPGAGKLGFLDGGVHWSLRRVQFPGLYVFFLGWFSPLCFKLPLSKARLSRPLFLCQK